MHIHTQNTLTFSYTHPHTHIYSTCRETHQTAFSLFPNLLPLSFSFSHTHSFSPTHPFSLTHSSVPVSLLLISVVSTVPLLPSSLSLFPSLSVGPSTTCSLLFHY